MTWTTNLLIHKGGELLGGCPRHGPPTQVERTLSALHGRGRWSPITPPREKCAPVPTTVRAIYENCPALGESTRTTSGRYLPERRPIFKIVPAMYTAVRKPDLATHCYRATAAVVKMVMLSKCCSELAVDIFSHLLTSMTARGGIYFRASRLKK